MKLKSLLLTALFFIGLSSISFAGTPGGADKLTAESVFSKNQQSETFNQSNFKADWKQLSTNQKVKLTKMAINDAMINHSSGKATVGEYILAVICPPLAVGFHTSWAATPTISNILWTCLFYLPGLIHAIVVLER